MKIQCFLSQENSEPRKNAGPAIVVHGLLDPADNSPGQVARQRTTLKKDINIIPPSGLFISDRRIPYNIPSDWRALWLNNLDELQKINDANDNNTVSNVTVQLGGTAFLHCKVRNLADRTVSDAEKQQQQQQQQKRKEKVKKKSKQKSQGKSLLFQRY
ncbi:hypothetical protein M0804_002154 [Polistes exclamans]|nr:hypothetical protein M0804_002154 [Polistes exclamans]